MKGQFLCATLLIALVVSCSADYSSQYKKWTEDGGITFNKVKLDSTGDIITTEIIQVSFR